jgi:hypothetical protein
MGNGFYILLKKLVLLKIKIGASVEGSLRQKHQLWRGEQLVLGGRGPHSLAFSPRERG